MSWNYAELSKLAKESGGPEALMNILVQSGKKEMIPLVVISGITGIGIGVLGTKIVEHMLDESNNNSLLVEQSKKELIDGIYNFEAEKRSEELSTAVTTSNKNS